MQVDPALALSIVAPSAIGLSYMVNLGFRVRDLERRASVEEAHARIIIRGLMRAGLVTQDEVDESDQSVADKERL
jgi:predicted DNA-binding transcriptional regulator